MTTSPAPLRSLGRLALVLAILAPGFLAAQPRAPLTAADVETMVRDLSNWGRWGPDDEVGALNLITPAKRREAAGLVKEGISVSLARLVETRQAPDNPSPFEHTMLAAGTDPEGQWAMDHFAVTYHGYAHTHLDSLCHLFHNGQLYNGYSRHAVTREGALKLSIHQVKNGIFTRGVLMDIPRLRGKPWLDPGEAIYPKDLEAWEKKAGLKVAAGDVVVIYTGRWARRQAQGPWNVGGPGLPGLHVSCAPWLKARDIAVLGSDGGSDVLPSGIEGVTHPVHLLMLHAMGVFILDNCDLEELSRTAARLNRWDFLLTLAPLPVEGGTGSPLNPIATF